VTDIPGPSMACSSLHLARGCPACLWHHKYQPVSRIYKQYVISLGAGDWILGRPSDGLDEGSVRTLKNKFKSTGRSLNGVLKYTVGGSDVQATRVETSVPPSRYNYMTLYMAWKGVV